VNLIKKLIQYASQKSINILHYRIEKQLVTEVGEDITDSEIPTLVTNIPKLSILSVSTYFVYK